MQNYDSVIGFYIPIGSKDYPKSWSSMDKFGFDSGDTGYTTPIYNASMNDVINVFENPITNVRRFSIDNDIVNSYISQIVFNKPSPDFDSSAISKEEHENRWITAMMICDYVFINQDKDTVIADFNSDLSTILPTRETHYVTSSLEVDKDFDRNRLNYIIFKLNFGTVGDDVEFKFYFNPDMLIAREATDRISVYLYEDLNNDEYIDLQEWEDQIIEKHITIFNNARYKYYKTFSTTYITDSGESLIHHFFVYSLTEDLTTSVIKNAIKDFLLTTPRVNGLIYTYEECVYHYPNLFTEGTIYVYPVDNKMATSSEFSSIITVQKFRSLLVANHVDSANENFENAELFFIGTENESITYDLPFSAIAVSSEISSSTKPISSRFQRYTPIYYPIDFANESEQYKKFHKLARLALSVLYNGLTISNQEEIDIVNDGTDIDFSVEEHGNVTIVNFVFANANFIVKKPLASVEG